MSLQTVATFTETFCNLTSKAFAFYQVTIRNRW